MLAFFIQTIFMSYALITGASKGIGKAIAKELAKRGHSLLLVARTASLLQDLVSEIRSTYKVEADFFAADLSHPAAPAQIAEWVQQKGYAIDILVNNAGYGIGGSFEKHAAEENRDMMQVNMTVPVELCNRLLPALQQHARSYILNIASTAAYQAVPGLSVYAATKAFMVSFSRGLWHELRKTGVSVTVVSPGGTATDFANRAKLNASIVKKGEKLNMTPEAVAKQAVDAMFAGKAEIINGFVNKLGAALAWLFPKKLAEVTAAGLYHKD